MQPQLADRGGGNELIGTGAKHCYLLKGGGGGSSVPDSRGAAVVNELEKASSSCASISSSLGGSNGQQAVQKLAQLELSVLLSSSFASRQVRHCSRGHLHAQQS